MEFPGIPRQFLLPFLARHYQEVSNRGWCFQICLEVSDETKSTSLALRRYYIFNLRTTFFASFINNPDSFFGI